MLTAIAGMLALTVIAGGAAAQTSSSKSRTGLSKAQIKLLDGRLSRQYENSKRLLPTNKDIPRYTGAYKGEYLPMAEKAAVKFGVPKELFARLIQMESNWNPKALSPAGAIGLAQLLPETAAKLGVDPYNPQANLEGGALYLKQQFTRFRSWKLAIAAYNAGPEAVAQYNDVPPFSETQAYVLTILGR
ncbi:MAG: lytic transglycosylase domain-containing protein [Alphaproteobacteria bacterium]|nr:lytic transglycosylase domain-containing protein [Alphaproteobacteria bacterium]